VNTGGVTEFANQVGGINPLASLTTDALGTVEFNGNVTTTGEQTYNDPATVTQNSVFTSIDNDNISFNNTLDGNSDVTINTGGTTLFGNVVGGAIPLTSLTTDAGGTTQLNGDVTTTQNQTYKDEVDILNSLELTSNQGQLEFQNNVNAGINNLTLTSLTGIEFGDNTIVSGTGNLTIQTSNGDRNIIIGQPILGLNNPFLIDNLSALANGFNSIAIGNSNTTNTIRVNEILTVQDPLTLQASDIFVLADINGVDDASITIIGDGNTTTLNADITTQGQPIIIQDNVLLTNDVTLDTTISSSTGANISVLGSINSSGDNRNLTINADNNEVFVTGNIGNIQPLNNLLVNANQTFLDGTLVRTTGSQQFNSDIFVFNNSILFDSGSSFFAQNIFTGEQAADITITASQIETGDIFSQGGNISLTSTEEFILTEDLFSSDGNNGGDIDVSSASTITTGQIDSSGSSIGGDINLNVALNQRNDITVQSINTSSSEGQAGNIRIATRGNLSVTETIGFSDAPISIDATGGNDELSGSIFIDLFPPNGAFGINDDRRLPFVVGEGETETPPVNGTAGIITNGESTIDPGSYTLTVKEGKITIRLLDNFNPTEIIRPIPTIIPTVGFADIPPLKELKVIDTIAEAQEVLTALEEDTKNEHGEAEKPAIVYLSFTPKGYQPENLDTDIAHRELSQTQEFTKVGITNSAFQPTVNIEPQDDDILDILVITAQGEPIRVTVPVTRKEVVENAEKFWIAVSDVFALNDSYKSSASNLYSWIVQPIKPELEKREITNLLFILPADLRFIPVAALYDAQEGKFLVEEYSSGLAPSLNLNKNDYRPVKDLNLLAMGASNFEDPNVVPLPAAGLELPTIKAIWNDEQINNFEPYTNQNFNFNTIQSNVSAKSYGIIHFGTHGEFNPDNSGESYIQLYNSRLGLDDIRELGLREPLVELMVLSACETAFGNEISELGFAGLAVKAGVKSAMGSVWQVSDTGTLALMSDFYKQLKEEPTKAQALRQAQLNMLYKKVYKAEDGNAIVTPEQNISLDQLPEESRQAEDFSHPFYWAPFTMIGNPW
jgi:CHAT domain-containing protein